MSERYNNTSILIIYSSVSKIDPYNVPIFLQRFAPPNVKRVQLKFI